MSCVSILPGLQRSLPGEKWSRRASDGLSAAGRRERRRPYGYRPQGVAVLPPYDGETHMTAQNDCLSRRKALGILGLATLAAYATPTALSLSSAEARTRRRRRTDRRRRRTDRRRRRYW